MHVLIRTFPHLHSVHDATRRAATGLMARLSKEPGFLGYSIFDAGNGAAGSVTFFKDRDSALAANALAHSWINESLLDMFDGEPDIVVGDILYSGGIIPATNPAQEP
jgi:hypothetical protein